MPREYVHIINALNEEDGGPVYALMSLVLKQKELKNQVSIICTYKKNIGNLEKLNQNIKYLRNKKINVYIYKSWFLYCFSPGLVRRLFKFDKNVIVHIHGLYRFTTSFGALICRFRKIKYIIRTHGALDSFLYERSDNFSSFVFIKRISELLIDYGNLKHALFIHFTSKREKEKAMIPKNIKKNSEIIPNGISLPFYNNQINIRKKYGLKNNEKIVLYIGRLHLKKGIDILIKSFSEIDNKEKNITLLIAGPGSEEYRDYLRNYISKLNSEQQKKIILDKKVERSEVKSYFSQSDLFVLPSHTENFGMVVIESIFYGCPVIISKQVDIYEELENYKVAKAFDINKISLANQIEKYIMDSDFKDYVFKNGKKVINKIYSWESISKTIELKINNKLSKKN